MNSYPRGSEWRRWDLHLHTPKTWLANQFGVTTIDDFVNKVVESGIAVIGLTNYFKFADCEINGANSIKTKLEAKGVVVFPNLEFRLDQRNKDNEQIHIHLLFRNEIDVEKIDGFLGRLKTVDDKWCSTLTDTEVGKVVVGKDTLFNTLKNESDMKHLYDYIIVGCPNGQGGFRPYKNDDGRGNAIAIELDKKSDAFFYSGENPEESRQFYLNIKKDLEGRNIIRYKNAAAKPVFFSSDAHNTDDIGGKFTWVKAQATFEGLIQVLFNPAERTRFQDNSPISIKSKGMIIDRIVYDDNNIEIAFNYDLVSIIGKRGDGKSILLKAIASKASENDYRNKVGEKTDSDVLWRNKVFGDNLQVIWGDNSINNGTEDNPKKVFFLPQGYLSNLAYDENAKEKERYDFLIDLLRTNDSFRNAEDKAKAFVNSNGLNISDLINRVFIGLDDIKRLDDDNKNIGSIANINSELEIINTNIKAISEKHQITDDDNERYQQATTTQKNLAARISIISQDIKILGNISIDSAAIKISDAVFLGLSDELKVEINKMLEDSGKQSLNEIVENQKVVLNKQIADAEDRLKVAEITIDELKPKFEQQKELSVLTEKKLELEKYNKQIEENKKLITEKVKSKNETLTTIKTNYFAYEAEQMKYFDTVRFDSFEFIDIAISINKKNRQFDSFIANNVAQNRTQHLCQKSRFFLNGEERDLTEDNFDAILIDLLEDKFVLKVNVDKKQTVHELLNNPYSIDFLDSIKTKGGGTLFRNMTGGQKAIALLELIFNFDQNRYPILLDQPEDDLDTSGVATSVVEFIKKQKEQRQIFIISHNGSLVVCADSEEVIVARYENNKFTYKMGAIEDKEIRKDMIDILEGGRDALQLRMKKLRI